MSRSKATCLQMYIWAFAYQGAWLSPSKKCEQFAAILDNITDTRIEFNTIPENYSRSQKRLVSYSKPIWYYSAIIRVLISHTVKLPTDNPLLYRHKFFGGVHEIGASSEALIGLRCTYPEPAYSTLSEGHCMKLPILVRCPPGYVYVLGCSWAAVPVAGNLI